MATFSVVTLGAVPEVSDRESQLSEFAAVHSRMRPPPLLMLSCCPAGWGPAAVKLNDSGAKTTEAEEVRVQASR
jgi:hypothetical protein